MARISTSIFFILSLALICLTAATPVSVTAIASKSTQGTTAAIPVTVRDDDDDKNSNLDNIGQGIEDVGDGIAGGAKDVANEISDATGLSTGAIIAIAIGIAVFLLILLILCCCCCCSG